SVICCVVCTCLFLFIFKNTICPKTYLKGFFIINLFKLLYGNARKCHFPSYILLLVDLTRVLLKKSGCRTPRIELEEMGPSFDFVMRRTHLASDDLYKLSLRRPKALQAKKKKNISHDTFGTQYGRIHMQKQDLGKLQTRKVKALKKRPAKKMAAANVDNSPKRHKNEQHDEQKS
ncbi:hypothetical protein GDO78_019432, partial [Eleutherodactylus coqui]